MAEEPLLSPAWPAGEGATSLVLVRPDAGLPVVQWLGPAPAHADAAAFAAETFACAAGRLGTPLLVEHSRGSFRRPGLHGSRLAAPTDSNARQRDVTGRPPS